MDHDDGLHCPDSPTRVQRRLRVCRSAACDRPVGGPGVCVVTPGGLPAEATPAAWSSLAGHAAPRPSPGPRTRATHAGRSPDSQVVARRTPSRAVMPSGRSGYQGRTRATRSPLTVAGTAMALAARSAAAPYSLLSPIWAPARSLTDILRVRDRAIARSAQPWQSQALLRRASRDQSLTKLVVVM